jgi:hypothetical protein
MSRRSRSNPWWERCDLLGHDCRWCRQAQARAVHLEVEVQVLQVVDPPPVEYLVKEFNMTEPYTFRASDLFPPGGHPRRGGGE